MKQLILGATIAFFLIVFGLAGVTTIEPGEVGVVVKNLGSDETRGMQDYTFDTGWHWTNPFTYDVIVYDTRLRRQRLLDIPSNTDDGQPILVDVVFEIGLLDVGVPGLHENIGQNYFDQVIYPAARSAIRNETAKHDSDAVYTGAGRALIQEALTVGLSAKLNPMGIRITANLSDIEFLNPEFIATLEEKATAAQQQVIQERYAEAAKQEAIKINNTAEGAKFKVVQEAEGERERLRLIGEGSRMQKEQEAIGILAVATAEAEGMKLRRMALAGAGGAELVSIAWAENLGPNVQMYGIPTGAPGTSTYLVDQALRGSIAIGGGGSSD